MNSTTRFFVAGHGNVVGAAIVRLLRERGFSNVAVDDPECEMTEPRSARAVLRDASPHVVIDTGGRSGGISANQRYPADLMADNLLRSTALILAAHELKVGKLLYLASSCSYPRLCPQPMKPEHLLTGPLEPTNEPYAVAKLAGIKLCQALRRQYGHDFIVGIPANPFGCEDDFSDADSHVIGALLSRMHEARRQGLDSVTLWGTGRARRELLFADDLADACLFVLERYSDDAPLNLGGGEVVAIAELAAAIREVVGFRGKLVFDTTKPDGMPLKSLDSTVLSSLGWRPMTPLMKALEMTYASFVASLGEG